LVERRPGLLIWTGRSTCSRNRTGLLRPGRDDPDVQAGASAIFTPRQDIAGIAVTRDHTRFLAAVPVEGRSPTSVMLNWRAALSGKFT
jgi:hypothetical protein